MWLIPTWLGVVFLVLLLVDLAPGDAASSLLGIDTDGGAGQGVASDERLAEFRARFLLDRSASVRFLHFVGPFDLSPTGHEWFGGSGKDRWHGLLALDLGEEMHRSGVSVAGELFGRLALTVPLAAASMGLALLFALPLGALSAARRGTWFDRVLGGVLFLLHAVPSFWGGMLLVLAFGATGLGCLPSLGIASPGSGEWGLWRRILDVLWHAVLPVVTLSYGSLAYLARQVRAGALQTLASDPIRTARAKGLPEAAIFRRHVLPTGLITLFTLTSAMAPALVGGSLVVETLFDLPGMGRYAFEGLRRHDLNIVLATTALAAAVSLLATWLAEVGTYWADPRIRARRGEEHSRGG